MRHPRIKATGEGFYHVVSRIVGRRFLLDDGEKGILLGMDRSAGAFSGVEAWAPLPPDAGQPALSVSYPPPGRAARCFVRRYGA